MREPFGAGSGEARAVVGPTVACEEYSAVVGERHHVCTRCSATIPPRCGASLGTTLQIRRAHRARRQSGCSGPGRLARGRSAAHLVRSGGSAAEWRRAHWRAHHDRRQRSWEGKATAVRVKSHTGARFGGAHSTNIRPPRGQAPGRRWAQALGTGTTPTPAAAVAPALCRRSAAQVPVPTVPSVRSPSWIGGLGTGTRWGQAQEETGTRRPLAGPAIATP